MPDTSFVSNQVCSTTLNLQESVPLQIVLSELLVAYRISDAADTQEMTGLLLQLSKALERHQNETVEVYRMRPARDQGVREVDSNGRIGSIRRLFQGPTRVRGNGGQTYSYPGDMAFRDPDRVAVQVHKYNLTRGGQTIAHNMPVVAVWVPRRMSLDWLVQEQPVQKP